MSTQTPQLPRREFKSKTPIRRSGVLPRRQRSWGHVTRHQASGHAFLLRRISDGVALRDTTMLNEALRVQPRALIVSAVLGVVLLAGAFIYSILKPAGTAGANTILSDRTSGALYVMVNDKLHPVLNLASARLIIGKPDNPTSVKSAELDKHPRGALLGIPGAPERIVQDPARDALWTVCDAVGGQDRGTTVISGPLSTGSGRATEIQGNQAILATGDNGASVWLIWGGRRSHIDLADAAVAASVGISHDTPPPRAINTQLLNLVPESPALVVPFIPNRGDPPRFVWPAPSPAPLIGSVVADHRDNQTHYYAVDGDGLQPIPATVAAMLRADNSFGLIDPPILTPDQVRKTPVAHDIPVGDYPQDAMTVINPVSDPITCGQWIKNAGAPTSSLTLLAGQSLPLSADEHPLTLTHPGIGTATRVMLPTGRGYFAQITGQEPTSPTKEAQYWISEHGVRYGIEGVNSEKPEAALGQSPDVPSLPIPWSILSLLAPGPTLSKTDALVEYDGQVATPVPVGVAVIAPPAQPTPPLPPAPAAAPDPDEGHR